ncbi:MAG: DUF3993 domain-containing protein [Ectobacillus sp.]
MKKYGLWIGFALLLAFIISQSVAIAIGKEEKIDRKAVFETIQRGYEVQYSIRGKKLSEEKMYTVLSPYFTDNFLQVFTDENSDNAKGSGNYLLPQQPPFSFSEKTKLVHDSEHGILYVYERINNMYEIIVLQKQDEKWKLAGYYIKEALLEEIKKLEAENRSI